MKVDREGHGGLAGLAEVLDGVARDFFATSPELQVARRTGSSIGSEASLERVEQIAQKAQRAVRHGAAHLRNGSEAGLEVREEAVFGDSRDHGRGRGSLEDLPGVSLPASSPPLPPIPMPLALGGPMSPPVPPDARRRAPPAIRDSIVLRLSSFLVLAVPANVLAALLSWEGGPIGESTALPL